MPAIMRNDARVHRRDLLKYFGFGATAAALGQLPGIGRSAAWGAESSPSAGRRLRIAHLTDIHLQPERGAAEGFARCLHHVQSQADKPDLIVVTGDCIMDSFRRDAARTKVQWDLWKQVLRAECSLPVLPLLGNHDIWGWDRKRSQTTGDEPGWGKRRACDVFEVDRPYYSVDRGGWHFVMLDSVQPFGERSYTAHLDAEQFEWLKQDLAAAGDRPTLIASHIPIISITPIMNSRPDAFIGKNGEKQTVLGHAVMHTDWRELRGLFKQHPQVKVALSGHLHLIDRVDYGGVSYLCNGAVSGGWWKKPHLDECDAGYALINLYPDGRFEREYVHYGWQYREESAATTIAEPAGAAS